MLRKIRTVDAYYNLIQASLPIINNIYSYLVSLEILVSKDSPESFLKKDENQNQFVEIHQRLNDKEFLWITEYKVTPIADQKGLDMNTLFPDASEKVLTEVSNDKVFNELTADFLSNLNLHI